MAGAILQVEGIKKSFNGTVANDGITLSIEEGECHGFIGPNGSGKTTFFDTITGFHTPEEGRVLFDGEEITGLQPDTIARRGLVRSFQITRPFEELSVRENLLATFSGGFLSGLRVPDQHERRAAELLDLLELTEVAENDASDISGGQQKLLELGRALMLDPDCLLLDEPTAGVNPATKQRLLTHLREINESGTAIGLIEHDMSALETVSDRVTVLNRGRVVAQGSFEEVVASPVVHDAYLGTEGGSEETSPWTGEPATDSSHEVTAQTRDAATDPIREETDSQLEGDSDHLVGQDIVTGYDNHTILHGVSVRSHEGITCIFGPNGSGKSTLLDALAGIRPIWSGSIEYGEQSMAGHDAHEFVQAGIAMVPQDDMVFDGLSVRENLELAGRVTADQAIVERRLDDVIEAFPPLGDELSTQVRSLSGGQQTMVGFGRALMGDAEVLLLDEPTSSLAPSVRQDIFEMIEHLVDQGCQVVLVEQNVADALPYADHVYLLARGRIQFDGPPEALRTETDILQNYLGMA